MTKTRPAWVLYVSAGAVMAAALPSLAQVDPQKTRIRHTPVLGPVTHGGEADDTFQAQNIVLRTWLPLNAFPNMPGSPSGADCWGYVSPSGREYALMGLSWGNGIVEVTDPDNPNILTVVDGGVNSLWRDITVVGDHAYAVSDSTGVGIQVMSLANVDSGSVQFIGNISQGGHSTTHTLLSNPDSGFLYACGGNANGGGMIPCSTTDPNNPAFTGPGWNAQYVHEAQIVNYTSGPYAGKEIAFLYTGGPYYGEPNGLAIVDVTNKNAPQQLSFLAYPGIRFSHQGWLSNDRKYLYQDDELDNPGSGNVPRCLTRVFDVSDLSNPRLCASFTTGLPSVDHNQYVSGRYLFQSNYSTGLHVWDLSDPLRPFEVAWIDTRPEDDSTDYVGAWGNYPFFPSGTVLISDLERGLFIVKMSVLEVDPVGAMPAALTPGQATPVTVHVGERDANVNGNAVDLWVSVNGQPFSAIAMTPGAGGNFTGAIPAGSCQDRVRYYFTATTDDATPRAFNYPLRGQAEPLSARVQSSETVVFSDDFETDKGWTVANTSVSAGAWVRGTPIASGGHGAAIGDADGSGKAFVTGNTANADLDGGPTRLTSPTIDLSGDPDAVVTYARWLLSIQGTTDDLVAEVSSDNGANWTQVETVGPSSGGWRSFSFRVADFVTPTAQVKLRFSVSDSGNNSTTEAGIDAVTVVSPQCAAACYADCNGDAVLNLSDFGCFTTRFATGDPYADCNGDAILNLADFGCFTTKFALGCP
ncbi:MAG: choice-of-anchor B family protein [Phycisphaerales bacterium]|nr:choice-of-anchor B family protein [Phycisphaerales bacterium]